MEQNRLAPLGAATDEPASPHHDMLHFDPVPLRYREDGLTPDKQREYVEALADCGIARHAAARVGVSEQAVNRVRRRPDARAFDRACAAAFRIGSRRLVSVAFERAIEGTIKRHTYHGEIVSEERVFDNRLLMSLVGKLPDLFEPGADDVEREWQPWMRAVEQGLAEPQPEPDPETGADEEEDEWTGEEIWQDRRGGWWTSFPPPDGFTGIRRGTFGEEGYKRRLTPAEQEVVDGWPEEENEDEEATALAAEAARRDRFFGFPGDEVFESRGCETYETSAEAADDSEASDGLAEGPAGGAAGTSQPNPSDDGAALPCRATDPASNPLPPSLQPRLSNTRTTK
jgi:hypothetical protein